MALNSGKILMRRGQEVNFDPNKMTPGEWAVSLDSKYVRMCFSPGVCIRMATYEAFEVDMEKIREILAECQTVEEAVQRIYEDIKDVAVDVERIEAAAASALESEENALNSANLAVQSANTATQKASEAAESADIASTKAEEATEGANTATQKASEAAESADNVRNMSDVSQSYAVGGTGIREGEDTDNAKYYNQQASDNADRAEAAAERASSVADVGVATTEKAGLVKPDGETIRVEPDGTIHADRGTTSYTDLENKPKINDVVLDGEKTLEELGIASKEKLEETDNKVNIIIESAELRFKENASGENIHLDDSADSKLVEFGLYGKASQNTTSGKNLLPYPYEQTTKTANGITFTDNGDGTITVNGTATADTLFHFDNVTTGDAINGVVVGGNKYILSMGCPAHENSQYWVFARVYLDETTDISKSLSVDTRQGNAVLDVTSNPLIYAFRSGIQVIKGVNLPNLTFKPMLRLASDTDDTWEPYTGGIPSPNPEYPQDIEVAGNSGSVEVKSENEDGTKSKTATIPTENGLAGIPVDSGGNYTDSNGQQWICDEVVKYADGSGEYVQRIKNLEFPKEITNYVVDYPVEGLQAYFVLKVDDLIKQINAMQLKAISTHFRYGNPYAVDGEVLTVFAYSSGGIRFRINGVTTLEGLTTWLQSNSPKVLYRLYEPISTPLTAEQLAEIEKLSTFYPVTSISNDADYGMKVKYIADAKSYIDNRLALIEQAMLNSI